MDIINYPRRRIISRRGGRGEKDEVEGRDLCTFADSCSETLTSEHCQQETIIKCSPRPCTPRTVNYDKPLFLIKCAALGVSLEWPHMNGKRHFLLVLSDGSGSRRIFHQGWRVFSSPYELSHRKLSSGGLGLDTATEGRRTLDPCVLEGSKLTMGPQ